MKKQEPRYSNMYRESGKAPLSEFLPAKKKLSRSGNLIPAKVTTHMNKPLKGAPKAVSVNKAKRAISKKK